MKRAFSHLVRGAKGVWLFVFFVMVVLWFWSYAATGYVCWVTRASLTEVRSGNGVLSVTSGRLADGVIRPPPRVEGNFWPLRMAGEDEPARYVENPGCLVLPYSLLVAVFGVVPVGLVIKRARDRGGEGARSLHGPVVNGLMALSLFLCLWVGLLWVQSLKADDGGLTLWHRQDWIGRGGSYLMIGGGRIVVSHGYQPLFGLAYVGYEGWSGFGFVGQWFYQGGRSQYLFACPLWSLMVVFGGWPFIVNTRDRLVQRRRRRRGMCVHWGYDLRATPGRCPECGARNVAATVA